MTANGPAEVSGKRKRSSGKASLVVIPRRDWSRCKHLFAEQSIMRCILDSNFRAHIGQLWADDCAAPSVALLDGCFCFLGGWPRRESMASVKAKIRPGFRFFPANAYWRDVIESDWGAEAAREQRWYFSGQRPPALPPPQIDPAISVTRLRPEQIGVFEESIDIDLRMNFAGLEDFFDRGFAFVAMREGRILAAAGSFAVAGDTCDLAVFTVAGHRRRSLARAVAGAAMAHLRSFGLKVAWNAESIASLNLARQLALVGGVAYHIWQRNGDALCGEGD